MYLARDKEEPTIPNVENGLASLEAKVEKAQEMYAFCVDLLSKGKIQVESECSHPITPLKEKTT